MSNKPITKQVGFYNSFRWIISPKPKRLLIAAAVFHISLAIGLNFAGKAQLVPTVIDGDGIIESFAYDSLEYRERAALMAQVLKREGISAWAGEGESLHVKLISAQFALLAPFFGNSPLSAEPLNLLVYLAVLTLVFALGNEIGGDKIGLLSAAAVALLPTFLFHTLQLLKDGIFIAGVLFFILCVTTWLTRTYNRKSALFAHGFLILTVIFLLSIRFSFYIAFISIVLLGLVLLIIRQIREKRMLYWNMSFPLMLLFLSAIGSLIFINEARQLQKFKKFPSDRSGQPKALLDRDAKFEMPSVIYRKQINRLRENISVPFGHSALAAADGAAEKMSILRARFSAGYADAGSGIDREIEFKVFTDLIFYFPRAFEIGNWAPFPNTWLAAGKRTGNVGKLVSGAETSAIYIFQAMALLGVFLGTRRLASGFLLAISVLGATALGFIIPNVGAIYRFRYIFWILLIILGIKGLEITVNLMKRWINGFSAKNKNAKTSLMLNMFFLAAVTASCSQPRTLNVADESEAGLLHSTSTEAFVTPALESRSLKIINLTGASINGVYLSPSDSSGWEENLLSGESLSDNDLLDIRLSSEEKAFLWDLRIVGTKEHFAEWKSLDLRQIGRIRLFLGSRGEKVAVAEIE